ncbi:hypothetical protein YC2023_050518 [Brassica napus]
MVRGHGFRCVPESMNDDGAGVNPVKHPQCVLGHKLEVLVIHDPSRPVPPPTRSETQRDGTWSEEKQFHVGDTLIFEYANEVNDVYQINGDLEFMTCDPTSPIAVHKTGHDLVKLTEP